MIEPMPGYIAALGKATKELVRKTMELYDKQVIRRLKPKDVFKAIWQKAWTKLWGHCQWIAGAAITASPAVNEFFSNANAKTAVDSLLPAWVGPTLIIIGVITFIASEHKPKE
jgi:polyferredoxin